MVSRVPILPCSLYFFNLVSAICILKTKSAYTIMPIGKKIMQVHCGRQRKAPVFQHRGFSIPFFGVAGLMSTILYGISHQIFIYRLCRFSSLCNSPYYQGLASVHISCCEDSWHAGGVFVRLCQHVGRSEERRVGKECRSRWSPYH